VAAVGPIRQAASGLRTGNAGIKLPFQLSAGGIEGNHFLAGSVGVERAPDDQRIGLDISLLAGVKTPCGFEAVHVAAVDLLERGVVIAVGPVG
jgi:hypothetical protein